MRKGDKLYARALMASHCDTDSTPNDDKLCAEAEAKQLYRWGIPKRGELVLRRTLDGFKQLRTAIRKDNEIIFLKISFARACRKEYERKFPNGDELQIMRMVE
mgnify:CR=1 FL=1